MAVLRITRRSRPGMNGLGCDCRRRRRRNPGMNGLGDGVPPAVMAQILETTKMNMLGAASAAAEKLAVDAGALIRPAGERVRKARADGFAPTFGDVQTLWAQRGILERAKGELLQLIQNLYGVAPGWAPATPGVLWARAAMRSLDAWSSQAADYSANTTPANTDDAFFQNANARFNEFMSAWGGMATAAANTASNAAKATADAAKTVKKLAKKNPLAAVGSAATLLVAGVLGLGFLMWVSRK